MGVEQEGRTPERTFVHTLETLRREGSNVLVVGDTDIHSLACGRLHGDSSDESRCHLVVTTDSSSESVRPHGGRTEHVAFRSTDGDVAEAARQVGTLDALGTELVAAIDDLEDRMGGLEPGQLRVCVGSLGSLLGDFPLEAIFRLLHVVTARTRLVDGLGHYHLRRDRTHETVHLLESLFDAVVEVRLQEDVLEGRWELRGQHTSSDWLSL